MSEQAKKAFEDLWLAMQPMLKAKHLDQRIKARQEVKSRWNWAAAFLD